MDASLLDYPLPPERIAQEPPARREDARLLAVDRRTGSRRHLTVRELPSLLDPGDLMVLNDTRVFQARLHALRASGGKVRLLLLEAPDRGPVPALVQSAGRLRDGELLALAEGAGELRVVRGEDEALPRVEPAGGEPWAPLLERAGRPPLPPYIRRPFDADPDLARDRERYQTVFARDSGSVAAPTAGLHLTDGLLAAIRDRGVHTARVTLHVGPGTFKPVKAETLEEHRMHAEWCAVPPETAAAVAETRARGGRVHAVGTTVVRTLESAALDGAVRAFSGPTELFIRPPFAFRAVDALLTNFHLPRSTLLALTAAFAGLETVLDAYREAVREGYRFYSYGDACHFS